ncbi:MAG: hypothetical protein AB7I19_18900 [Planctomycetota bacterium]
MRSRLLLVSVTGLLGAGSLAAQTARQPALVPSFGTEPTGASFGYSFEEEFAVVAETLAGRPGVHFRIRPEGENWSAVRTLQVNPTSEGLEPTVIVVDEEIFICWVERVRSGGTTVDTLFFDTSFDEGDTWTGPSPMNPGPSPAPIITGYRAVGVGGQPQVIQVLAVYADTPSSTGALRSWRSTNAGRSFAAHIAHASGGVPADGIAVAVDNLRSHIAWSELLPTGGSRVLHTRFEHSTGAPSSPTTIATTAIGSDHLALSALGDRVGIAWLTASASSLPRTALALSADRGNTFTPVDLTNSHAPGARAMPPQVAVAADECLLAFTDDRRGADHVFLTRVPFDRASEMATEDLFGRPASAPRLLTDHGTDSVRWIEATAGTSRLARVALGRQEFGSPFPLLDASTGNAVEAVTTVFDPRYRDFRGVWLTRGSGRTEALIGGARPQRVRAVGGAIVAGRSNVFELDGFAPDSAGQLFAVVLSGNVGQTPLLIDNLAIGLEADALFFASLSIAQLRGQLSQDGGALSGGLFVPPSARGLSIVAAAFAITSRGSLLITDPTALTIR